MQSHKRPTYTSEDFGRVRLYGLELTSSNGGLDLGGVRLTGAVRSETPQDEMTGGLIVGYAFEGGCYDLPKPKIIFTTAQPRPIPPDDCGYDAKDKANYRVWVVDKLDRCIEVEVTEGLVEHLVLEANLPGRRSPAAYRSVMQVAHRSGRLGE